MTRRLCVLSLAMFLAGYSESGAGSGLLIVANKGDRSMGIIDPIAGRQIATVAVGGVTGHELAASSDGRTAYVPIYGNSGVGSSGTDGNSMTVIDIGSRRVTGRIDFGRGVRPHCVILNPRDGLLYVTAELDNAVVIVDPRNGRIVGSIPTGQPESHMLAVTRDGRRGYTSNVGPGTVSVLDLQAGKTLAIIPVSPKAQRISLSVDDRMAFTADQTSPRLAVIDTSSNQVKHWVPLPGTGYGTASTRDGRWLLVAVPKAGKVAVVDLHTLLVARSIDVPSAPQEVLVRPDNQVAYVSCDASQQVAEISLSAWKVNRLIEAGKGVDGLPWIP